MQLEALRPLAAGILSERRASAPFGLLGGKPGAPGLNLLVRARSGRMVNLGGKATVQLEYGDRLVIHTPGAGGYGPPAAGEAEGGEVPDNMPNAEDGAVGVKRRRVEGASVALRGSVHEYKSAQEGA